MGRRRRGALGELGVGGWVDEDVVQDASLGVQEGRVEAAGEARSDVLGYDALQEVRGVVAGEGEEAPVCELCGAGRRGWGGEGGSGLGGGAEIPAR